MNSQRRIKFVLVDKFEQLVRIDIRRRKNRSEMPSDEEVFIFVQYVAAVFNSLIILCLYIFQTGFLPDRARKICEKRFIFRQFRARVPSQIRVRLFYRNSKILINQTCQISVDLRDKLIPPGTNCVPNFNIAFVFYYRQPLANDFLVILTFEKVYKKFFSLEIY